MALAGGEIPEGRPMGAADLGVQMVHGAAINGPEKASMLGSNRQAPLPGSNIGIREKTAYVDFSQDL